MSKTEAVAATRRNGSRNKPGRPDSPGIAADERQRYIAEAAYFRAQERGFAGGEELEDWLIAEAQINAQFPAPT